jgi:hypothetical protein
MAPNRPTRTASHRLVARLTVLAALALSAGFALVVAQAGTSATVPVPDAKIAGNTTGFLSECTTLPEKKMVRCYTRGLLNAVESGGNPSTSVPKIDDQVHAVGGFLEAACHSLMHDVGRTWAKQHGVTVETLFEHVPRSNDPGCSGGFGMGMAMYLGPELIQDPDSILRACGKLPTRFREYTCVHGSGHAFMRGYHGSLEPSVDSCKSLGPDRAPDCSQGAFHDYWISLGGGDGTETPDGAGMSAEAVCSAYEFKRPCWFRYFWERESSTRVYEAADILGLCEEHEELQRAGCIAGASLNMSRERDPVDHARTCQGLEGSDVYDCLRGVNVPALDGKVFEQLRLVNSCGDLPSTTKWWCYAWFGRTLTVLTDGEFGRSGCAKLEPQHARVSCKAGARRIAKPLRTFS